jgi:hypothetical protein
MIQEFVFGPGGVIRECNLVGNMLESPTNPGQEGRSGRSGEIDVRGGPLEQKFGRTGSHLDGMNKRCHSLLILSIRIRTIFQEELNKVKVGRR